MNSFDLMVERYRKEMEAMMKNNASGRQDNREIQEEKRERIEENTKNMEKEQKIQSEEKTEPVVAAAVMNSESDDMLMDNMNDDGTYEGEETGKLKVQVFAANGVYPVTSAFVRVYNMEETKLLFQDYTDVSGIVGDIELPAPRRSLSQNPVTDEKSYAKYVIKVTHPRFRPKKYVGVPVFSGIESIQPVQLTPRSGTDDRTKEEEIVEREPNMMEGVEENA